MAGVIELAQCVEALAGGRAAYPLYREAYARERSPQVALALARSLLAIDPTRARAALARIAESTHAVAVDARELLGRGLADNGVYNNSWGSPDNGVLHRADASYLVDMPRYFQETATVSLTRNYRSSPQILTVANQALRDLSLIHI